MSAGAGASGGGSGGAPSYRVTAYVNAFNSGKAVEVYSGRDREIALAYVRGYTGSGTYVHLTEQNEN